jgi:glutathione S-transferase
MPIVHGVSASPFVRKTRVFLAEKGIDYELEPVMPGMVSDEFRKMSPLAKVPVYQDGDFILPDSSAICAYLEKQTPDPALYPSAAKPFGQALWYEEYADTKLVEVTSAIFFQRFVQVKIYKQAADEEIVRQAMAELVPPVFDYLEGEVSESDGIVGDRFSIADISLGSPFVSLMHGDEQVDATRWPRLAAYVDRILARPSFQALIEEEVAAFAAV